MPVDTSVVNLRVIVGHSPKLHNLRDSTAFLAALDTYSSFIERLIFRARMEVALLWTPGENWWLPRIG